MLNKLQLCFGYILLCYIGPSLVYGNRVQFVWLESLGGRRMDKLENVDGDACSEHDNQVHKCRKGGCQYNCADNTCNAAAADLCPECANFCHDICSCKLSTSGCQYNVLVGACRPSKGGGGGSGGSGGLPDCHCGLFESGECARPDTIYANGGELCINRHFRGTCTIDQTIVAVNTGDGHRLVHSNGVNYQADEVAYTDPHHTRDVLSFGSNCACKGEEQENLYKMIIVGKVSKVGAGNCLTYEVALCLDGFYELIIHTVEFIADAPRMRMFNILFNGVLILPEIDPFILGHGARKPVELHINFQVTNNGTTLRIPGHKNTAIPEGGYVDLSFCYGECEDVKHKEYVIAGFAVVRFLQQQQLLRQVATLRSIDIRNVTGTQSCGKHGGNTCSCKRASCESNVITDSCEPSKVCGKMSPRKCEKLFNGLMETESRNLANCHRHDAYYVDGGVICKSVDDLGDCTIDQVIMAIKTPLVEGTTLTDSRGVEYLPPSIIKDPQDIYFCENVQIQKNNCPNLANLLDHAGDRQIYETQITAKESKVGGKGCYGIAFQKSFEQDGKYELSIKLIESKFSSQFKRGFQIMFNDMLVVAEMNILQYVGKCEPFELILPFQIKDGGKTIIMQGFPPMPLMQGHDLKLAFCYGDCTDHPIPVLSAFYVAKMGQLD